jgi:C4-type Zn-finger protein
MIFIPCTYLGNDVQVPVKSKQDHDYGKKQESEKKKMKTKQEEKGKFTVILKISSFLIPDTLCKHLSHDFY